MMVMGKKHDKREGFAFASLVFGLVSLVTWKWVHLGPAVAVMSVGFGVVALIRKGQLVSVVGMIMGTTGLILSLTRVFLLWP